MGSKTKIELDYPYSADFKQGFLNINKEPRRVVLLVRDDGTKTSTSYARYLMSCHLKRYLTREEHVDHIDNDKLNDKVENLQLLSIADNNRKKNAFLGITKTFVKRVCPVCNTDFERDCRNISYKLKNGKTPTCSRRCGAIFSNRNKTSL
jgi:hypothetical protein